MAQIYLLSVVLNFLTGLLLAADYLSRRLRAVRELSLREYFDSKRKLKLGLAAATAAVGLLKLLVVSGGDVPVVGDVLPAAAGLCAGFTLWLDDRRVRSGDRAPHAKVAAAQRAGAARDATEDIDEGFQFSSSAAWKAVERFFARSGELLVSNRAIVGFAAMLIALIHFLVPGALFF